ncbi:hypothetical protein TNCV_899211 [Trichonephila clavipes]|nr:hypothetical protein TNCV_899211 [Trichonephila clavipes]
MDPHIIQFDILTVKIYVDEVLKPQSVPCMTFISNSYLLNHDASGCDQHELWKRFRERRKADAAMNFSAAANLASTSNTGIPVLMDVTNEQTAANLASTSTTGIPVFRPKRFRARWYGKQRRL